MKKTKKVALISFALAALSFAACKKERTCTCTGTLTDKQTMTGTVNSSSTTSTNDAYVEKLPSATKKTAKGKADCRNRTVTYESSYTAGGTTTKDEYTEEWSCTIK